MSDDDLTSWHVANDAYLSAAVEWLRLLLARHAAAPGQPQVIADYTTARRPAAPPSAPPPPEPAWWRFRRTNTTAAPETPPPAPLLALPAASTEVTQQQLDEAAQRMNALEASDPPPAIVLLARRFGLSLFERNLLLLASAMELDTRIAGLCARVHDDPQLAYPTFGLAFTVFQHEAGDGSPHWDARAPERPLRFWRMIETNQQWPQPLTASPLRADERMINYVKGVTHLDDRVAPFVTPLGDPVHDDELPESQRAIVDEIVEALQHDEPQLRAIQLLGRDRESKALIARAAAHRLGLTVYKTSAEMLPSGAADLETLSRLAQREALLLPVAFYIDAYDVDRAAETHAAPLKRFLSRTGGVLFIDARETWPTAQGSHTFEVDKPTPFEQRDLWKTALGDENAEGAARLAAQFNLSSAAIVRIADEAKSGDESVPLEDRVWQRAGQSTRMRIDALAQRIDALATWDDLVLPDNESALLRQIAAHVGGRSTVYDDWGFRERMNRGLGISALFSGESGTGKTMAAEVIANELGLTLHRIDLSSVVSKWVGETEKNLQQLFNAADDSNGILFFDEADALFGKRTEVQHSQDRFANIEINFLLQRLESYRGLAILATNMKSALDQAFMRRLRFIVPFPFPDAKHRRLIWSRAFPEKMPKEDLDLDRLARLTVPGGGIHNIALSAAFIAAERGTPVTMPIVLEAARTELRKLEKPINEADFRLAEVKRA